jgi:hypothetical protein
VGDHLSKSIVGFAYTKNKAEGGAELMRMAGSMAQLAYFFPKWSGFVKLSGYAGPVGLLVSELFGLAATLLTGFLGQEQKKIADQLKEELGEFSGEEVIDLLAGVLDQLELEEAQLRKAKPNGQKWGKLFKQFVDVQAVTWLGKAQNWLEKPLNQERKVWPYVLKSYLLTEHQYLDNFILVYNAFDKIKASEHELGQSQDVLAQIVHRCETFLEVIGPLARNHGTVWHIGKSGIVYERGMVVGGQDWHSLGGWSTRLSVASDERIWTVGTDHWVWSGYKDSDKWKKLSFKAQDIYVVRSGSGAGSRATSYVYTIENGRLCWRVWDEGANEDAHGEKFFAIKGGDKDKKWIIGGPLSDGITFKEVVGNEIGYAYLWGDCNRDDPSTFANRHMFGDARALSAFGMWNSGFTQKDTMDRLPSRSPNDGPLYKGISADNERVYIFDGDSAYFSGIEPVTPWKEFPWPHGVKTPVHCEQLFACEDGAILAIINRKIWLWDGKAWKKNEKGDALRVLKHPVLAWQYIKALEDTVISLKTRENSPHGGHGAFGVPPTA